MTDIEFALHYSDMAEDKLQVVAECVSRAPAGYFLEVGTRKGGSAIRALQLMPQGSVLISVDPYGSKPYIDYHGVNTPYDFPDAFYIEALHTLSATAIDVNKHFVQYKMTSLEFLNGSFNWYESGAATPIHELKFSYVLLDGDHDHDTVKAELEALEGRVVSGGVILVDNSDMTGLSFEGWEKPRVDQVYKIF